jgi:2-methylisocitrate lyase-like PEP mutase family enzyme
MGFQAAFVSGAGISESRLGRPDVGLMGLTDTVGAARDLARCVRLPLIADADTGYGNAINVYFAVRAFEEAGAAGVMIEDQVWPKRCGHLPGKEVIAADEMTGKIEAAAAARSDPELVIVARTDAAGVLGLDEAIERAIQYAAAGADVLFADALLSEADIERFIRDVPGPVAVNMGFGIRRRQTTPLLSARRLEQLGTAAMIVPRLLTAAAVRGMQQGLRALQESLESIDIIEREELTVSFEELNELVGLAEIQEIEQRFVRARTLMPGRLARRGQPRIDWG